MTTLFVTKTPLLWSALLWLLLLSACSTPGPMGKAGFDESFARTIEIEETLEHYVRCHVNAGTYMEGEMALFAVHKGVLVVTDKRLIFAQWNSDEHYYQPQMWIHYKDIKRLKKQNDTLLQYIAIEGPDNSKNTYNLPGNDVEIIYKKIMDQIKSTGRK